MNKLTDGPTNRLTNIASYRVACLQLKKGQIFFCLNFDHYAFAYWLGHQLVNFAHRQPISCGVSCFVLHSPQSCLILIHTQMHIKSMCLLTTISLHLTIRVTFYPLKNALTRN